MALLIKNFPNRSLGLAFVFSLAQKHVLGHCCTPYYVLYSPILTFNHTNINKYLETYFEMKGGKDISKVTDLNLVLKPITFVVKNHMETSTGIDKVI